AYDGVGIACGDRMVVEGASFSVGPGRIVGLVGESGSGKTTLLKAAMGLLDDDMRVQTGHVLYQGEDVAGMSASRLRELRGEEMATVFQDSAAAFCPVRRINVQAWEAVRPHVRMSRRECEALFCERLESLGIREPAKVARAYPHELSGGMAQRVGIAVALMLKPRLLLADEPTSALDVTTQAQVVDVLRDVHTRLGCAILLVTHNFRLVEALCDDVVVLRQGRVVEQGPVAHVLTDPADEYTRALVAAAPRLRRE
ncbi:MAG: ABC transporter ATP-binding protein, partial [Coriobacteriales bacterium]|nr:ABC transporter ATP-binding protein [Coriobacteriales bacterium]